VYPLVRRIHLEVAPLDRDMATVSIAAPWIEDGIAVVFRRPFGAQSLVLTKVSARRGARLSRLPGTRATQVIPETGSRAQY
jgi:hypothetical protein